MQISAIGNINMTLCHLYYQADHRKKKYKLNIELLLPIKTQNTKSEIEDP